MWTHNACRKHPVLIVVLWAQLLSLLGQMNAIEIPLEVMDETLNVLTSSDSTHRTALPQFANRDMSVNMPPNVDEFFDFSPNGDNNGEQQESDVPINQPEMPPWLQFQHTHQQQLDYVPYHSATQQTHNPSKSHHHHTNRQVHSTTTSPATSPLKRCSIEISSKIPGICQAMGSIGNACVSGDYIDVFNAECL